MTPFSFCYLHREKKKKKHPFLFFLSRCNSGGKNSKPKQSRVLHPLAWHHPLARSCRNPILRIILWQVHVLQHRRCQGRYPWRTASGCWRRPESTWTGTSGPVVGWISCTVQTSKIWTEISMWICIILRFFFFVNSFSHHVELNSFACAAYTQKWNSCFLWGNFLTQLRSFQGNRKLSWYLRK